MSCVFKMLFIFITYSTTTYSQCGKVLDLRNMCVCVCVCVCVYRPYVCTYVYTYVSKVYPKNPLLA